MQDISLITGASGFIGRNLTERLVENGDSVHVVVRNIEGAWRLKSLRKDINVHNVDLEDENEISKLAKEVKANKVFHLAAYGQYYYQRNMDTIIRTNLISSFQLLKEFSKYNLEIFVNASSSSEYGIKDNPMREDMVLQPDNMYGASKAASTILCSTFSKLNKIPFVTLRLFSPYGYYDAESRLIPSIILSSILGRKLLLNKKDSKRDYIFIDDAIDAFIMLSSFKNVYGEVFNVGSGFQYTNGEILNKLLGLVNKETSFEWGFDPGRQKEPDLWVSDIDKIKCLTNWSPQINIDTGLQRTVEWFESNYRLYPQ